MTNKNIEQVYQTISNDAAFKNSDRRRQVDLIIQTGREKGHVFKSSQVEAFLVEKEDALSDEALDAVVGGKTEVGGGTSNSGGGGSEDRRRG